MSSGYPYQQSPSSMPASTFYPQSMAVLTPSQANLHSLSHDSPSGEFRTAYIKTSVADVLGTSVNRSSSVLQDVSSTSPYRQPAPISSDNISSSPYTQSVAQPPMTSVAYSSSIDGVPLPPATSTGRNVVYSSSQPFPQNFEGMVMAPDGNYYASSINGAAKFGSNQVGSYPAQFGSNQTGSYPTQFVSNQAGSYPTQFASNQVGSYSTQFGSNQAASYPTQFGSNQISSFPSQFNSSNQFGNQFGGNQFGQFGGFQGGLTPRGGQSMTGTITTTQNGVTTTVPLTSATQMALNGLYQDPNVSQFGFAPVNILPTDPSMVMFADCFRNECMMLSQYYQEHPEERPLSPKSDVFVDDSPAWSRPPKKSMKDVKPSNDDQENECTANATPVEGKQPSAAINTLLDQLAYENDDSEGDSEDSDSSPTPQRQPMSPPIQRPAVKQSKTVSMLSRFACGRAMLVQFGH